MKKLDFLFFDAGGGHRSAANALRLAIEREGRPWEVRLVNLQELLDPLDVFRKLTGLRLQDVYNLMLKKGWTLGSPQLTAAMHLLIRLYHREAGGAARTALAGEPAGHGRLARPELQPRRRRERRAVDTGRAVRHGHYRYRRLPAALLDRARIAVSRLRVRSARWSRRARSAIRMTASSAPPA